jgi:hypothetical protein
MSRWIRGNFGSNFKNYGALDSTTLKLDRHTTKTQQHWNWIDTWPSFKPNHEHLTKPNSTKMIYSSLRNCSIGSEFILKSRTRLQFLTNLGAICKIHRFNLNPRIIFKWIILWTKSMSCEPFVLTPVHGSTMDQRRHCGRGLTGVGRKATAWCKSSSRGVLQWEGSGGVLTDVTEKCSHWKSLWPVTEKSILIGDWNDFWWVIEKYSHWKSLWCCLVTKKAMMMMGD